MWDEMHADEPVDDSMREATESYLRSELAAARLCGWLALDGDDATVPVGLALLMVHEHPPRITGREKRGYVTSVFVERAHRRRGHGRALMDAVVDFARAEGLKRVMLRSSDDGRRLYASVGFRALDVLARDFPSQPLAR